MNETNVDSGLGANAGDRLRAFIERVERLTEEKKAIAADIKEIYGEVRAAGFDVKCMRQIVRERAMDPADRAQHEALMDLYRRGLGMLADTPLGEAALAKDAGPPRMKAAPLYDLRAPVETA